MTKRYCDGCGREIPFDDRRTDLCDSCYRAYEEEADRAFDEAEDTADAAAEGQT